MTVLAERSTGQRNSRAVQLYLIAFFLTNMGVGGFTLAAGLILFAKTGSALAFGALVGLEFALGFVGQLIGGSVLDRLDVLRVAIITNALRSAGILVAAIAVLLAGTVPPLLVAFLISAIIRPLYRSASFAIVPRICARDELLRVNGLRFGLLQVAQVAGLVLVSLLNAWAPSLMLLGVAACLIAGTVVMARLRTTADSGFAPVATSGGGGRLRSLTRNWTELAVALRRTPTVLVHLLLGCVGPMVVALASVLVAPVNAALGGGPLGIAVLDGGAAVGSLIAVGITRTTTHRRLPSLIAIAQVVMASGLVLLGTGTHVVVAASAFVMLGCGSVLSATALDSLFQLRTAPELVGRMAVAQEFAVSSVAAVALPLFGGVMASQGIQIASYTYTLLLGGFAAIFAVGWLMRRDQLFTSMVTLPERKYLNES